MKETHFLRGFVSAQQTGEQISHALGVVAVLLRHGGQHFPERGRRGVCRRIEPLRQRELLRIDAAKILRRRTQTRAGGGRDAALARVQEIFHLQLLLVRSLLCRDAQKLLPPGTDALCQRCVKRGPSRLGADALGEQIGQRVGLRRCGRGRVCAARHTLPDALKCAVVKKNGILHRPYPHTMLWPGLQKRAKCAIITAETFPSEATIMARFFIAGTNFPNGRAIIRGRDADHIRVLRLRAGDDIVICDGGSTDGSMKRETLALYHVNTLLTKTGPGRQGAQLRMGMYFALDRNYKGILTIDGNNKDSIEDVPEFIAKLQEGYDLVQGSRFIRGGHAINTPPVRYAAVRLIHAPLVSLGAHQWFTDTTNAYRAYSREYLTHPDVRPLRDVFGGYELLAYLSIRATQLGLKACEVPVTRAYPATGKTPTKISGFKGNSDLMKVLLNALAGQYNP